MDLSMVGDFAEGAGLLTILVFVIINNQSVQKKLNGQGEKNEKKFVDKNVCKILHEQIGKDVGEIKKTTSCVPAIKAGMDMLLKKNGLGG